MRVVAIIQCTTQDLYKSRNPEDYVITCTKNSGLFDRIVLAVPNGKENKAFDSLSKEWQVELVKGPVYDVTKRLLVAAKKAEIIVRLLLRRFYLDTRLVAEMIKLLIDKKADYVNLPRDFNYELAADVFTKEALKRVDKMLTEGNQETLVKRFNPWFVMEVEKGFKVITHPGSKNYSKRRTKAIKEKLSRLLKENQISYPWNAPISAYAQIEKHLKPEDIILDIATGKGDGARRLKKICKKVMGVDIDRNSITQAKKRFKKIKGLNFLTADALKYSQPRRYDVIVSMHTLEHLAAPIKFLNLCRENLKMGGNFFLEVPLLLPRPLREPLYPFHKKEFTIKELEFLLKQARFIIKERIGRCRNVYTALKNAREAVQYHCVRQ